MALAIPTVPTILLFFTAFRASSLYAGFASIALLGIAFFMWRFFRIHYLNKELSDIKIPFFSWYLLFLLGFLTHTLLDCFTTYGTMLLWPFSDVRISWDAVNVVDPFYTVPLMVCLLIAINFRRNSRTRIIWNAVGLSISTGYLLLGLYFQGKMLQTFDSLLKENGISHSRMMCTPTVFNNMLWYCLAETKDGYVNTYISMLDNTGFPYCLNLLPSTVEPSSSLAGSKAFQILRWFSNEYYQIVEGSASETYVYRDLRFGNFDLYCEDKQDFIFEFSLMMNENSEWQLTQKEFQPDDQTWLLFKTFVGRVLGQEK